MGNHNEEERLSARGGETRGCAEQRGRPAPWKGGGVGTAAAQGGRQSPSGMLSARPSLRVVRGLAFDDSAASRLPGEIWPTV